MILSSKWPLPHSFCSWSSSPSDLLDNLIIWDHSSFGLISFQHFLSLPISHQLWMPWPDQEVLLVRMESRAKVNLKMQETLPHWPEQVEVLESVPRQEEWLELSDSLGLFVLSNFIRVLLKHRLKRKLKLNQPILIQSTQELMLCLPQHKITIKWLMRWKSKENPKSVRNSQTLPQEKLSFSFWRCCSLSHWLVLEHM